MNKTEPTPANIRMMAMNLLAMREHSAKELRVKLTKKCDQPEMISFAVAKLQSDGLQSDNRFAEAFTNMRLRQGKGAQIIRLELKEKGINDEIINQCLLNISPDTDWNQLALKAYQKKFGDKPVLDLKEKSKRMRFLAARGFSADNIQYVFKQSSLVVD
jgi:regulatory protein